MRKTTTIKKNTTSRKKTTAKSVAKKAPVKKKVTTPKAVTKKKTTTKSKTVKSTRSKSKKTTAKARSTSKITKMESTKKTSSLVFSLEEARGVIDSRKEASMETKVQKVQKKTPQIRPVKNTSTKKHLVRKAASTLDILGFNPKDPNSVDGTGDLETKVPKKFLRFYKMLIKLRTHVLSELDLHTQDTLQHDPNVSLNMDNSDTDNMNREFALSLVSSEQEALFEIEEAIQRIYNNTYGVCEITGNPISKERLLAVPFTRFSVKGQTMFESQKREEKERRGKDQVTESRIEDVAQFTNEDAD